MYIVFAYFKSWAFIVDCKSSYVVYVLDSYIGKIIFSFFGN